MARGMVKFGHAGFSKRSKHINQFFPEKTTTAENVLFNAVDADDAAANWIASAGHKKNILGNFTHTGVGVAADKKGHYYFTQIFIR